MSKWKDLETKLLSHPEVKKEYNKLQPHDSLIAELIKAMDFKSREKLKTKAKKQGIPYKDLAVSVLQKFANS